MFFLSEGGVRSIDIVEEREKVMCFPESILVDFFLTVIPWRRTSCGSDGSAIATRF